MKDLTRCVFVTFNFSSNFVIICSANTITKYSGSGVYPFSVCSLAIKKGSTFTRF